MAECVEIGKIETILLQSDLMKTNKSKHLQAVFVNLANAPPSPMGYIVRKANVMKRCPKVKQNMRINMVLTIFDNIVRFKRNHKK